jgi:hypothetical protein
LENEREDDYLLDEIVEEVPFGEGDKAGGE